MILMSETCKIEEKRRQKEEESEDYQGEYEFPDKLEPFGVGDARNPEHTYQDT